MTDPGDIVYLQKGAHYRGFSESDLVEQPAIELFATLGWTTGNLFGEFSGGASVEARRHPTEPLAGRPEAPQPGLAARGARRRICDPHARARRDRPHPRQWR